ncbi:hypothetical protein WICPIJ_005446 [Wickerhamomyces pijperi]|uniref:Transcription initiation factor IIA large subunit n=1 Tax=Wickerhamomyces pijperi TaxID=599730 RepID=A0A9P8TLY5_WICPI|nr:hypothetical protein WICPIJ_005446 [Wickerhamomyces pijperi]
MSNRDAAKLYNDIIDDVITESTQDFENNGIDEQTLQDLKRIWRENLEQTKVAKFPWMDTVSDGEEDEEKADVKTEQEKPANFELELDTTHSKLSKEVKRERTMASLDSDDINSDLDDSDEDDHGSDEDGDEAEGMIIMCLYEKVLRVKNKWKCNLKDGIANINGRDYVFAKATGESEW